MSWLLGEHGWRAPALACGTKLSFCTASPAELCTACNGQAATGHPRRVVVALLAAALRDFRQSLARYAILSNVRRIFER